MTRNKLFLAQTFSPAFKAGEFVNELDPMIRLYDDAGDLVAFDDNSALDGRNAKLEFRVPKGGNGVYFVEVTSSSGKPTSGEYILTVSGTKNINNQPPSFLTSLFATIDVLSSADSWNPIARTRPMTT